MTRPKGCADPECEGGHPSANCYHQHRCRCRVCKRLTAPERADSNARASRTEPTRSKPLDIETLHYLRRLVGLPEELPEGFRIT
jgi:hypothetical protein